MFSTPELQPLARLLAEPGVTDLVCNGSSVTQVLRGGVWHSVHSPFADEAALAAAAKTLIASNGRRLDLSSPFATAMVDRKVRAHAVLASAVSDKTLLSLRVIGDRSFGLNDLVRFGVIDEITRARLSEVAAGSKSFVISGASGAGKTTLLRSMLLEVASQRIVAIEDIAELQLESHSFVSIITRPANVEGRGEIDLDALLVESLRMRADRIVVGEVRSAELVTFLQAANSGHSVATTLHANSAAEVMKRLASIGVANGLTATAVQALAANSISCFIHIDVIGSRRKISIHQPETH